MPFGVLTQHGNLLTYTVTQNYFPKCGFGVEDAVNTEEEDHNNSDWVEA